MADRACWIDVPISMADHPAPAPTRSRTLSAVVTRSRATAHSASLRRRSAAFVVSRDPSPSGPTASSCASAAEIQSKMAALAALSRVATSRSRTSRATPSGSRRRRSSSSRPRAAASAAATTSRRSAMQPEMRSRRSRTSEAGRTIRVPGPRRRAMMPHTWDRPSGSGSGSGHRTGGRSRAGPRPERPADRQPRRPAVPWGPPPSLARAAPCRWRGSRTRPRSPSSASAAAIGPARAAPDVAPHVELARSGAPGADGSSRRRPARRARCRVRATTSRSCTAVSSPSPVVARSAKIT